MIRPHTASPLYPIANPGSIAVFGASNNPSSMGTSLLDSILELGFPGEIYPVHPREKEVQGLKAYSRVLDLPFVPDLALIVLPTDVVAETLEQCGQRGIKHAVIISGGFKEVGAAGQEKEKRLQDIAKRHGIRFLGPNCIGLAHPRYKLNTTFMAFEGIPGFIGMASQSGSFVTQMFSYLCRFSLGFSVAFSLGNEADLDLVDCLSYLGACPETKVIALYIEGIRRGREFVEAARAIVPHKPIVACYIGGTEAGRRAGFSHTGALSGPENLYEGIFRQSGIVRAETISELFDFCWLLGTGPPAAGNRVVIQTHSGGPGAEAADACGRCGLELPPLSPETSERLRPLIPPTGSLKNPVDLTFNKNFMDYFSEIPRALLEDEGADCLLAYLFTPSLRLKRMLRQAGVPAEDVAAEAEKIALLQADTLTGVIKGQGKPFVGYTYRGLEDGLIRRLIACGIPVYPAPRRAARAIGAACQYARLRDRILKGG